MEESFNFLDADTNKTNISKKEDKKKENIFTKINNSYKDFMRKIKLGFIVDKIDKYFPSLILFIALFLIILFVVLYFVLYTPMQEYKIEVYVDNKLVSAKLSFNEDIDIVKNTFKYYPNKFLNLKIQYNKDTFEKRIKTDKPNIRVDLEIVSQSNKVVDKTFSFSLQSKSGQLTKDGIIKLDCENYSQEFNIVNGILQNIIIPCDAVKANVTVEGLPPASQTCTSGLCKINMNDPVSAPSIGNNVSKNKLLVYVTNADNTPAKGIEVSVRENNVTQTLIDKGLTKDHGNYLFELIEGDYTIIVNDLENRFAVQTRNIKITAGASINEYFVLDVPNVGVVKLDFDVEDNNFVSGFILLEDVNNKLLLQKEFDSNSNLEIGIKALGKYKISVQLDSKYNTEYDALDYEFDFKETIEKTIKIKKCTSFDYEKINVQVIDSTTNKPIPNIRVYFTENKGSLTGNILHKFGVISTDFNGSVSQMISKGSYTVHVDHHYLNGSSSFLVVGSLSLEYKVQHVKVFVNWGSHKIKVSLHETVNNKLQDLNDAFIEMFSENDEFISSYYLDKTNFIEVEAKLLSNIYFKISKPNYRELYTQEFFINKNEKLELDFELTASTNKNSLKELNSEFLGIYSGKELRKENVVSKLENAEYYAAFKVLIPKEKFISDNKLYFYGVAGDLKDENAVDSKVVVRKVYGLGNDVLYDNYFDDFFKIDNSTNTNNVKEKIISKLDKDLFYTSKSFSNSYNFNSSLEDVEMIYVVKIAVTNEASMNDKLFLHYKFSLNNVDSRTKTITYKYGRDCRDKLCVEIYQDDSLLPNTIEVLNSGKLVAKVEYNYDSKANFAFYNSGLNDKISKLEDITSTDFYISKGKLNLESFVDDSKVIDLNKGPIYASNVNIQKTNYLEMDFNYNLATNKNTNLYFSIYDDFSDAITIKKEVSSINTEQLNITYDTDFLVPFIENEFKIYVKDSDDHSINAGEVRYYYNQNGQYVLGDINNISLGLATLKIKALPINDEIKIVVDVPNYKLYEKKIIANFDFLSFDDISIEAEDTQYNTFFTVSEITNKSKYDVNVYNGKYTANENTPNLYLDLLNIRAMESFFGTNDSLIKNITEKGLFKLKVAFNREYFKSLNLGGITIPLTFSFNYLPKDVVAKNYAKNIGLEYSKILNLNLSIKLKGALKDDCLILDLENSDFESFFSTPGINKLNYLEETNKTIYAVIKNTCKLDNYDYKLKNLDLIISTKNIPLNASISYADIPITSVTNGANIIIPLSEAREFNESQVYRYKIDLGIDDFETIKNSINPLDVSFKLDADYLLDGADITYSNSKFLEKELSLLFTTYDECITFELDYDSLGINKNTLEGDVVNDYCVAGTNCEVLRLPYYLKGERELNSKLIVIDNANSEINVDYSPKNIYNGVYEINSLPLILKNECGVDLNYSFQNLFNKSSNINYFKLTFENSSNILFNENYSLQNNHINKLFFNRSNNKKYGAYILKLDVNLGLQKYVKELYINVEDEIFYVNSFVGQDASIKMYSNKYYPADAYTDFLNIDLREKLYDDDVDDIFNMYLGKFVDIDGNTIAGCLRAKNDSLTVGSEKLDPWRFRNENCKIFEYDWEHKYDFSINLDFLIEHSGSYSEVKGCYDGGACGGSDGGDAGAGYRLYVSKFFKDVKTNNEYFYSEVPWIDFWNKYKDDKSFEMFVNKDLVFPDMYIDFLKNFVPVFNESKYNDYFFITMGHSFLAGDGREQDSGKARALNFCPIGYSPRIVYLDAYFDKAIDPTKIFAKHAVPNIPYDVYTYSGYVGLNMTHRYDGTAGLVDRYGAFKSMLICAKDNVNSFNRPEVDSQYNVVRLESKPKFVGVKESNCFGKGITGEDVVPKLSYDRDVDCQELYCNNYQLANFISKLVSSNNNNNNNNNNNKNNKYISNLNLVYDNYSKDAYNKYVNTEFLVNKNYNVQFNVVGGLDLQLLPTGRYDAHITVNDKNILVDLFYQTYTLPDHLFYYMPYANTIPGNYLGTALDGVLTVNGKDSYPVIDETSTPLFNYQLKNDLKSVSGSLPVVLEGFVNFEDNQGNGQITFEENGYNIKILKSLDNPIPISNTSYAHIWVKYNGKFYDGSLYYKIVKENNKLRISPKYEDLSDIDVYLVTVIKNNKISNLNDIFNNIKDGNICYTLKDNTYTYFWNIPKLLEEYDNK